MKNEHFSPAEIELIKEVKSIIQFTAEEYEDDDTVDPTLLWKMIKLKMRDKTYSKIGHRALLTKIDAQ